MSFRSIIFQRWAIKLGIFALGLMPTLHEFFTSDGTMLLKEFLQKASPGFFFSVALCLLEQLYEVHQYVDESKLHLSNQIDDLSDRIVVLNREASVAALMQELKGPLGRALEDLNEKLENALVPVAPGFIVKDQYFALISYHIVWNELGAEQRKRAASNEPRMTALIVHCCSIHIWLAGNSSEILDEQKEFIESGGVVKRILCGTGSVPDDNYTKVAAAMASIGVEVFYVDKTKPMRGHDLSWDFLVVSEVPCSVVWKFGGNSEIERAAHLPEVRFNNENLVGLWGKFADRIKLTYKLEAKEWVSCNGKSLRERG